MGLAFEKIMQGLEEAREVIAHAQSDAAFDGRDWAGMGRTERSRYVKRVVAGYKAVEALSRRALEQDGGADV